MLGIGWFHCKCGRIFAGLCKGHTPSKCHGCGQNVIAEFISPGTNADAGKHHQHHCGACGGHGHCPVVRGVKRNNH